MRLYLVWADMVTSSGDYTSDVLGVFSSYYSAIDAIEAQPQAKDFIKKNDDLYEHVIDETLTMYYEIKDMTLDMAENL